MMYYMIKLDNESKEICTIVMPFGKFQYCRLAMGLKVAPNITQLTIEQILHDINVDAHIDCIGIFTNGSYEEHLALVEK
eukprot:14868717-Ditylum_brightwellii.AAC.1